ncbi:hypothetical protein SAMN05216308_11345 [Nitrosospira sp. Nsp13]|nr:hypothetical protein SAMN05216308_11345 [Nitrosospira sp. Nsp13]
MTKNTRREYLETIRKHYRKVYEKGKNPILDDFAPIVPIANRHSTLEHAPVGVAQNQVPSWFMIPQHCWRRSSVSGSPLIRCARRSSRPLFYFGCPTTSASIAPSQN